MTAPAWLTRTEAARHLRCSLATLDRLAGAGVIKRYKVSGGRKVLFRTEELDAAVQAVETDPRETD